MQLPQIDHESTAEPRAAATEPGSNGSPRASARRSRAWSLERRLVERMLRQVGDPAVAVVLWDGSEISTTRDPVVARVVLHDRLTLWKLVFDPHFQFGEAYGDGRLEVAGDLQQLLVALQRALRATNGGRGSHARWRRPRRRNTLAASRRNIHHHYDLGNEFYKLWLDDQMVYTCAYFAERSMSLEEAQVAKLDHVCRKLQLQPGESVVEAGCGWGALALHMARKYGVNVRAFNISHQQINYARDRARSEGLQDRVEFIEDDWRNINGRCDVFVSVGMLEHVGLENYRTLGEVIHRTLEPAGRGLIHTIGLNYPRPLNRWTESRIFPGAQPPALSEIARVFEPFNFCVLDVENIRLHYAETLKHWLRRYEDCLDVVRDQFDETFVRAWRLYLASSAAAFETGWMQLFQVLFAPGGSNNVPWTREYQYAATDSLPATRQSDSCDREQHVDGASSQFQQVQRPY